MSLRLVSHPLRLRQVGVWPSARHALAAFSLTWKAIAYRGSFHFFGLTSSRWGHALITVVGWRGDLIFCLAFAFAYSLAFGLEC